MAMSSAADIRARDIQRHGDILGVQPPEVDPCARCNGSLTHEVADVLQDGRDEYLVDAFRCEECGATGHVARTLRLEETQRVGPAFRAPPWEVPR